MEPDYTLHGFRDVSWNKHLVLCLEGNRVSGTNFTHQREYDRKYHPLQSHSRPSLHHLEFYSGTKKRV